MHVAEKVAELFLHTRIPTRTVTHVYVRTGPRNES